MRGKGSLQGKKIDTTGLVKKGNSVYEKESSHRGKELCIERSGKKRFAHEIMYPKSSPWQENSLLQGSRAKRIAYFLQGVPGMLHLLGRIRFSKYSRDTAHCEK